MALLGLTLPLGACSGGYPLPPTRCDEWCDATRGGLCEEYYDPAGCVVECEQVELDSDACSATFDAALSCFRNHPHALEQRCVYDTAPDDCQNEFQSVFLACAVGQPFDDLGGEGQL